MGLSRPTNKKVKGAGKRDLDQNQKRSNRRFIRTKTINGVKYVLHATKGWRKA